MSDRGRESRNIIRPLIAVYDEKAPKICVLYSVHRTHFFPPECRHVPYLCYKGIGNNSCYVKLHKNDDLSCVPSEKKKKKKTGHDDNSESDNDS